MKTTKAYLAGLGTTGILIGSVMVLMVLGTGIVAFDGLPGLESSHGPLERVVVDEDLADGAADTAGRKRHISGRVLAGAQWYRLGSRPLVADERGGAALRRTAAGRRAARRRSHGHGGAQARAGTRLGGGASTGNAGTGGTGSLPGGSRGPPRGQPGPGRADGGGVPLGALPDLAGGTPPVPPPVRYAVGGSGPRSGRTSVKPPGAPRHAAPSGGGRRGSGGGALAPLRTRRPAR